MNKPQKCPECGEPVTHVRDWPTEMWDAGGSQVAVPLASAVYRCAEHGDWRINIRGDATSIAPLSEGQE